MWGLEIVFMRRGCLVKQLEVSFVIDVGSYACSSTRISLQPLRVPFELQQTTAIVAAAFLMVILDRGGGWIRLELESLLMAFLDRTSDMAGTGRSCTTNNGINLTFSASLIENEGQRIL